MLTNNSDDNWPWIFLIGGFVYFGLIYGKYRNQGARHTYELETKRDMKNVKKYDNFVKKEHGLSNSTMKNANNTRINGKTGNKKFIDL